VRETEGGRRTWSFAPPERKGGGETGSAGRPKSSAAEGARVRCPHCHSQVPERGLSPLEQVRGLFHVTALKCKASLANPGLRQERPHALGFTPRDALGELAIGG
jgi:hypothetical protein